MNKIFSEHFEVFTIKINRKKLNKFSITVSDTLNKIINQYDGDT
jgi:hypothetical protein